MEGLVNLHYREGQRVSIHQGNEAGKGMERNEDRRAGVSGREKREAASVGKRDYRRGPTTDEGVCARKVWNGTHRACRTEAHWSERHLYRVENGGREGVSAGNGSSANAPSVPVVRENTIKRGLHQQRADGAWGWRAGRERAW